jgi:hypothetical protein
MHCLKTRMIGSLQNENSDKAIMFTKRQDGACADYYVVGGLPLLVCLPMGILSDSYTWCGPSVVQRRHVLIRSRQAIMTGSIGQAWIARPS